MKHLENNQNFDLEALKQDLDMAQVPEAVDQRLRQVYAELPDQLPVKKRGRSPIKAIVYAAGAVAAAFLMLFGVNAMNPAFAEELPLIGSLFTLMNTQTMTPMGGNVGTYQGAARKVNVAAAAKEDTGYGLTVDEAFCDGKYIYATLSLSVPEEAEDYMVVSFKGNWDSDYRFLIGGKEAKEVNYAADKRQGGTAIAVVLEAPAGVKDGETFTVSCEANKVYGLDQDYHSNGKYDTIETGFTVDFPVTVDLSRNTNADVQAMDNGVKLYSVERTPGYFKVDMEMPVWGTQDELVGGYGGGILGYVRLFTEDGQEIRHNSDLNQRDYGPEVMEQETVRGIWGFDGPAEQDEKVILRIDEFAPGGGYPGLGREEPYVFAEFTIDWKNGTAAPSENYLKEGLKKIDTQEYQDMEKFPDYTGGYLVENLVIGFDDMYTGETDHGLYEVTLLAGTEEYRPLEVRFFRDGKLAATVKSHPESEFNDTMYSDDGPRCYRDETGVYTAYDTDFPEKCDGKQYLIFAWHCPVELGQIFSNAAESASIQVVDSQTGEVLFDNPQLGDIYK